MSNLALEIEDDILNTITIPPQPDVMQTINRELDKDNPDINLIAAKISEDGSLFSSVLRVINSPYFGMRCEITSIKHAITLLGMDNIVTVIASIKFKSRMQDSGLIAMPRYWDNALDVARLSSYLAMELRVSKPHEAYALGMFKDVGIPILAQRFDNYKAVLAEQNHTELPNYTDLEDRHFNTNHCIVGLLLTRKWGMSQVLRDACRYHHDVGYITSTETIDDQEARKLILISKIAEHVANLRREEAQYEWNRLQDFILDYLCMSEPDYTELRDEMLDHMDGV